jgi:hypothetical protein
MSDNDVRHADGTDQHILNKRFGAFARKGRVEMLDKQQIDIEPGHFALLDPERRQAERLAILHEDVAWMRLEGQHRNGRTKRARLFAHFADQRGMPLVQPVKITERQHRAARMGRSGTGMSNDAEHGCDDGRFREKMAVKITVDGGER